jgi:hypothetical protein
MLCLQSQAGMQSLTTSSVFPEKIFASLKSCWTDISYFPKQIVQLGAKRFVTIYEYGLFFNYISLCM